MKETRYFGASQWVEMREFTEALRVAGETNITITLDIPSISYVVYWDVRYTDLENK